MVLVAVWWLGSGGLALGGGDDLLIALGRLAGLLAEFLILIQLLLIGRIHAIERAFGHDRLLRPHRWIGYSIIPVLIAHPLLLARGYGGSWAAVGEQLMAFVTKWADVDAALFGFVIMTIVVLATLPPIRRRLKYETWYGIHLLIYVGIGLAFGHQINSGDVARGGALIYWLGLNFFVFGVYLAHRALWPLWLAYRHQWRVISVRAESANVWSIIIGGRNVDSFKYQAGQFANVYFLQRGMWHSHPFSFSTAPGGETIRFTVKSLGDFTGDLGSLRVGTRVMIDGPLGRFTEAAAAGDRFLLIAGGIGITPIRALAESLAPRRDVVLCYAARSEEDLVLRSELESFPLTRHYFVGPDRLTSGVLDARVPDWRQREIYLCGPTPMMASLIPQFIAAGVPQRAIHFERFAY